MNKLILAFAMILALSEGLYAQSPERKIEMHYNLGGMVLSSNYHRLSRTEVENLLKTNEEAYKRYRAVDKTRDISSVLGGVGGFLVGYTLGAHLVRKEPNWKIGGLGAGICLISVPFSINYNKEVRAAVKLYNEGLDDAYTEAKLKQHQKEYIIASASNGLGLSLKF